ncbi:hypothetical protein V6N13_111129 [Hibiscus sabdariffa]
MGKMKLFGMFLPLLLCVFASRKSLLLLLFILMGSRISHVGMKVSQKASAEASAAAASVLAAVRMPTCFCFL